MTAYNRILLLVLSLYVLELSGMATGIRKKRVMFGLPTEAKDRDAYYPHFRYYVFLAKGARTGQIDESPSWLQKWSKKGLAPTPMLQHCGGSLLTPSIVQTACHCLAKYTKQMSDNFTYAVPMNVWEDRIYSYVGSNIVSEMYYMLIPKHYIIYEACRKVSATKANIYDFALIINKDTIDKKAKSAEISYVPVYKAEDIRNFYYRAIQKEYTCLFIGFGKWNTLPTRSGKTQIDQTNSDVLRWGWRSLRNYIDCRSASYPPNVEAKGHFDYRLHSTWVCFRSTTKNEFLYAGMPGDSGGPVSCNGVYFAVQSFGSLLKNDILSMVSPIARTSFENAAEYRDEFINFCKEFGSGDRPDIPVTQHPNPYQPTPPSLPLSQSPPKVILRNLMILSSTLFTCLSYFEFPR